MHNHQTYNVMTRRSSLLAVITSFFPQTVMVTEAQHAVLVRNGRYHRVLTPGRHRIRPRTEYVITESADAELIRVVGQEILTNDGAVVRSTVVATVRIDEPITVLRGTGTNWRDQLYLHVQLVMRSVMAELDLERLLEARAGLDALIAPAVIEWAEGRGLTITDVALRDLVVPGELRRAVTEVLTARLEGRAALERARGESAALRNLANAAKVAQENPALLQLRLIQQIENSRGNTWVIGTQPALAP